MSMRFAALIAILAWAPACAPDQAASPPAGRSPQVAAAPAGPSVPASRWRAVLIAGDNNSPSFDNGVDALRDKLASHGVRDVLVLTSDPRRNPSVPVATAANVSSALRTQGGEACLVFITSHGDERGVALAVDAISVVPQDAELEMKALNGSTQEIHAGLVAICNAEISKILVGQTLSTELDGKGGSRAAAEGDGRPSQGGTESRGRTGPGPGRWRRGKGRLEPARTQPDHAGLRGQHRRLPQLCG